MAKRKKRKSSAPNLPPEALERARKQLDGTLEEDDATDEDSTPDVENASAAAEESAPEPVAEAVTEGPATRERSEPEAVKASPAVTATRSTSARSSRRERRSSGASSSARRSSASEGQFSQRRKSDELDPETIAHLLANPTKTVTEEELHEQYGYVLGDLRTMGILAAVLMVLLVLLAQLI